MGNSEVGHTNLGAGRVVYQDLTRIDKSIREHDLETRPALLAAYDRCAGSSTHALHLIGLLSDGGVHSHQQHLHALIALAKARGVSRVFVHVLTDGRDTSPTGGRAYVAALEAAIAAAGVGRIASVSGRYWAMDRDKRWERTKLAYDTIVHGEGPSATSARRGDRGGLRRRTSPTSSSSRTSSSAPTASPSARSATATRWCSSTSAPIACARSCGRWRSRTSTASIARAAARGRASR